MNMTFEQFLKLAQKAEIKGLSYDLSQNKPLPLTGIVTDSREVKQGDLFVCIVGENTDGHAHAVQAVNKGAVALLANTGRIKNSPVPVLFVDNTVEALGKIAHEWRNLFQGKVIGITGTAGKTTVKEILAQVLTEKGTVARNQMNLNTQIGLPVSMLNAKGDEDFWVMEAGISHAKDMDELGAIMQPDIALILNAGLGHVQGLGKDTAFYKTQLLKYLKDEHSIALVSADYPELAKQVRTVCPTALYFSITGKPVSYRASYSGVTAEGKGSYRLWLDGASLDVECALRSSYGVENVIAIAAAAQLLGLNPQEIVQGLAKAVLPKQRFEISELHDITLIDDSYNANPLSCKRMIEAAAERSQSKPLVCVMGTMLELGESASQEHEKLGEFLAASGTKHIYWKGDFAADVRTGLEQERYTGEFIQVENSEVFGKELEKLNLTQAVFLVKASRSNKLEYFVKAIKKYYE